jgi:hypothetical protein
LDVIVTTHLTHNARCPHCGIACPLASNAQGERVHPKTDDMSLCVECGRWARFDEHMQLVKPTPEDMAELGKVVDLERMHMAWVMATQIRPGRRHA